MDSAMSFNVGEQLTAAKMNALVQAVNRAGMAQEGTAAGGRVPSAHQGAELRMPVEPAGGFYDLRRGLAAMQTGIPGCALGTATAWVGHAPGVQTLDERRAASCGEDGMVWSLQAEEGASLWQVVRTDPNGEVCTSCTRYVGAGCCAPEGHAWSVSANEGGQVVRLLGRVVRSPMAACGDFVPPALMYEVVREHDLQLPVLTQGARIAPRACHTGYQALLDASRGQTPVVYNLGLHAPEWDFKLTYDASAVTVWQNQVVPPASGGHVYRGPGSMNGSDSYGTMRWWGHDPAIMTTCAWAPGCDRVEFDADCSGCAVYAGRTVWQRVRTDEYGSIQCVERCVRSNGAMPPGQERFWDPDLCVHGELWHRVGHIVGGRAVTDVDWRLPVLTQNHPVTDDVVQSRGVRLLMVDDTGTPNRYVKRLLSCVQGIRLCDRGCVVALVSCC